ncbi:MAG: 50S ribosomal protein L34e [Candidatus Bathyarchaeia archaeon]
MPRRSLRTRSVKRKTLTLPGGRSTIHYRRKVMSTGSCSSCGRPLRGVPTSAARGIAKSSRRPSRPFGGQLCHNCLKEKIRQTARVSSE